MKAKVDLRALLLGLFTDIAGTECGMFLAVMLAAPILQAFGLDLQRMDRFFSRSPLSFGANILFGLSFTALGGYLTAELARSEKLRHALGMGFLSELINLARMAATPRTAPNWFYLAFAVFTMPAALLGGQIGLLRQAHQPPASSPGRRILRACVILAVLLAVSLTALGYLAGHR